MEDTGLAFTEEDWETVTYILIVLSILPALFIARFFIFMILPKSILKHFWRSKQGYKKGMKKKEKKFYED